MLREKSKKIIIFFFPWKEVSGGPFYLASLANELANDDFYEVWYTDYEPGLSDALLQNTKVNKLIYSEPFLFPINKPVIFIIPIYDASHIPKLPSGSKILFLNWHNYCIQSLVDIWKINNTDLQRFLRLVYETDAVFFMDRAHLLAQNMWIKPEGTYTFNERYVPITIEKKPVKAKEDIVKKGEINIAILSRLVKDKVFSILNLLGQLEEYNSPYKKNVYIIGEGSEEWRLYKQNYRNNINLIMTGTVTGTALDDLISMRSDILFAMGRSILEGAVMCVPSVIIPHNTIEFSKDAYVYLQDTVDYTLGWYDTQIELMGVPYKKLSNILDDIYVHNKKGLLGKNSFNYVNKNHLSNIEALKYSLVHTRLKYEQFAVIAKRQRWITIKGLKLFRFSTSFDETSKCIALFNSKRIFQMFVTPNEMYITLFGKRRKWLVVARENYKWRLWIRIPIIKYGNP